MQSPNVAVRESRASVHHSRGLHHDSPFPRDTHHPHHPDPDRPAVDYGIVAHRLFAAARAINARYGTTIPETPAMIALR